MNSQNVLVSVPVYTKILDLDNDKLKTKIKKLKEELNEIKK